MMCYNFEYIERGETKDEKVHRGIQDFCAPWKCHGKLYHHGVYSFLPYEGNQQTGRTDKERRRAGRTDHEDLSVLSE